MRKMYALGTGTMALAAVVATGLAAHADKGDPAPEPAAHSKAAALPAGYQIVTLPPAIVPNFLRRGVFCPPGKHVLGGGAEARGADAILVGSFPTSDGRGWIAVARQKAFPTVGLSVYAICAF